MNNGKWHSSSGDTAWRPNCFAIVHRTIRGWSWFSSRINQIMTIFLLKDYLSRYVIRQIPWFMFEKDLRTLWSFLPGKCRAFSVSWKGHPDFSLQSPMAFVELPWMQGLFGQSGQAGQPYEKYLMPKSRAHQNYNTGNDNNFSHRRDLLNSIRLSIPLVNSVAERVT